MTALRLVRIAAIAFGYWFVFTTSQQMTAARNAGETVPGVAWAIGALTIFFAVGAFASERTLGPEQNVRKDLLWALSIGGIAIVLHRLTGAVTS